MRQQRNSSSNDRRKDDRRDGEKRNFSSRTGGTSSQGSSFKRTDDRKEGGFNRERTAGTRDFKRDDFRGGSSFKRTDDRKEGGFNRERTAGTRDFKRDDFRGGSSFKRTDDRKEGGFNREKPAGYLENTNENREKYGRKEYQSDKKTFGRSEGFSKRDNQRTEGFQERRTFSHDRNGTYPKRNEGKYGESSYKKPYQKYNSDQFRSKKQLVEKTSDEIRLNRFIAHSGICSRREADTLILAGMVQINGQVITELGYKVMPSDTVKYDGKTIKAEQKVYVLLNKPKGFITTTKDERERKTVMDLVSNASPYRIYPVGRLDRATTGVLLFTNDGDMAEKLTHPSKKVRKVYHVVLDKKLSGTDLEAIEKGIQLDEGVVIVDAVSFIGDKPKNEVGIELHVGWNRVVRRIFEKLGYEVERLDRVAFGGLTKKGLSRGQWRILTEKEIGFLQML